MNAKTINPTGIRNASKPNDVQVATSLAVLAKVQAEAVIPHAVKATSGEEEESYMLESPHPALDLSFMRPKTRKDGGGIDYWNVASAGDYRATGNYTADCEKGRALADEYLKYLGEHPTYGNRTLLGCIVLDMIAKSPAKGLVLGFMAAVNEYAMSVARIAKGMAVAKPSAAAKSAAGNTRRQVDDNGASAPELGMLIRNFYADKDAWHATADADGDLIADGPEYERSWASCKNLIRYQCQTQEGVRRKVSAILENGWLTETAELGFGDEPFGFSEFLKTLSPVRSGRVEPVADPLLEAINAFRTELARFNAASLDSSEAAQEFAAQTFEPRLKVLAEWNRPAVTLDGAKEALRLMVEEIECFERPEALAPLLRAALAYLDGRPS